MEHKWEYKGEKVREHPDFSGFPKSVRDRARGNCVVFWAENEMGEKGAALIFSPSPVHAEEAVLRCLYKHKGCEEKVLRELMSDTLRNLHKQGIHTVYSRVLGTNEEVFHKERFLMESHFVPISTQGLELSYVLHEICESEFGSRLLPEFYLSRKLIRADCLQQEEFLGFLKEAEREGFRINPYTFDETRSFFYRSDDGRLSLLCAVETKEGDLVIDGAFVSVEKNREKVWSALLAGVLAEYSIGASPGCGVHIQIFDPKRQMMITRLLGTGEIKEIREYLFVFHVR